MPFISPGTKVARRTLHRLGAAVRGEPVLSVLVVALLALQLLFPRPWRELPSLVDWQTVMTLAGLLILTRAVQYSGFLMWGAHRVVHRMNSERALAWLLIGLAAALSTLLTNDVALFVVIPLVLSLNRFARLPVRKLVIFVALAVNAGSMLTPLGNPQNLFLWQLGGVSFGRFMVALAPLALVSTALLFGLAAFSFSRARLDLSHGVEPQPVDRPLLGVAALAFVGFVALADAHRPGIGLAALAVGFLLWRRAVVMKIDWLLLLIFVFMFMVLRSVAALPWVHAMIGRIGLGTPMPVYAAGLLLSQVISNVPAAIMLAEFTHDWRALAYGVNVGGFGLAVGSLANLIAVRLSGQRRMWGTFHLYSAPFWLVTGLIGAWFVRHF